MVLDLTKNGSWNWDPIKICILKSKEILLEANFMFSHNWNLRGLNEWHLDSWLFKFSKTKTIHRSKFVVWSWSTYMSIHSRLSRYNAARGTSTRFSFEVLSLLCSCKSSRALNIKNTCLIWLCMVITLLINWVGFEAIARWTWSIVTRWLRLGGWGNKDLDWDGILHQTQHSFDKCFSEKVLWKTYLSCQQSIQHPVIQGIRYFSNPEFFLNYYFLNFKAGGFRVTS